MTRDDACCHAARPLSCCRAAKQHEVMPAHSAGTARQRPLLATPLASLRCEPAAALYDAMQRVVRHAAQHAAMPVLPWRSAKRDAACFTVIQRPR